MSFIVGDSSTHLFQSCIHIYMYIYTYICLHIIYVVEISLPYMIVTYKFHWYWRLAKLRYRHTGHVARMGEITFQTGSCMEKSKRDVVNKEGPRKFSEKGSRTTCTSLMNWCLGEIWSTRKHKYFRKTGKKIRSKRAIQEKKKQNILNSLSLSIYILLHLKIYYAK